MSLRYDSTANLRFDPGALRGFAAALFEAGGMEAGKAVVVAEVLVEGDLLGHDTHGLNLLAPYLDGLASGDMKGDGRPTVLSSTPVAETWEGAKLPGPWLVCRPRLMGHRVAAYAARAAVES